MQSPTKKIEAKTIKQEEVKKINPNEIQCITLLDGSIILINNPKTSENQADLITQAKPLFTTVQNAQDQYNNSQQGTTVKTCTHCHRAITVETQNQNLQTENVNQTEEKQVLRNVGQQNLKKPQLWNDMITYNEGSDNYYGGEQEQAQDEGQAEAQY